MTCHCCCHTVIVTVIVAMIIVFAVNIETVAVVFQEWLSPLFKFEPYILQAFFGSSVTIMISIIALSRTVFGSKVSLKKPCETCFFGITVCTGIKKCISIDGCCL